MRGLRNRAVALALAAMTALAGTASAAELNEKNVEKAVGTVVTLRVSGIPDGADAEWKSSNPSAAVVNREGRVRLVGEGTAEITAKIGDEVLKCVVTARRTSLNSCLLTMEEGDRETLKVVGAPDSAKAEYSSTNPSVVTASENGVLEAVGVGKAAVAVKCLGKTLKCAVKVIPAGSAGKKAESGSSTEENKVRETILSFREKYPEGFAFTDERTYPEDGRGNGFCGLYAGGAGCAAFAFELSDAAFGIDAPAKVVVRKGTVLPPALERRRVDAEDLTANLRAGDVIRLYGDMDGHTAIVLSADSESVTYAEANKGGKVRWNSRISKEELRKILVNVITRY